MKTTADNSRCLRARKFHFLCLTLLIVLLFCRSVTAQQTSNLFEEGSNVIVKGSILSEQVVAQNDSTAKRADSNSYWVDLGLGWGGQGHALDIGFSYEVVPQRILSLRYTGVRTSKRFYDYLFYIPIASYPLGKDASAVEITYGMLIKGNEGIVSFSVGLSLVKVQSGTSERYSGGYDLILLSSDVPDDYQFDESSTVGLVVRAQFMPSLRWGGIGISPCININPKYTFAGVTIQLAFGKMREKARK